MSADLCPGSGKSWGRVFGAERWVCPGCGVESTCFGGGRDVPRHRTTVEVLPDPDPWCTALFLAWMGNVRPGEMPDGSEDWADWHAVAAEARRLAKDDPAIRVEHWREAAEWAITTTNASVSIFAAADRIERGEQP